MLMAIVALVLLVLSGILLDSHRRSWNAVKLNDELDELQVRAARAQYLRRMQASGVMGVIGVLLMLRPLIPERPLWFLLYLLTLVLLCGWMLMLALVDAFAASLRLRQTRQKIDAGREDLEAQVRAARERRQD